MLNDPFFVVAGASLMIGFLAAAVVCGILFCELVDWVIERDD
jgi:hypothetical protein